jgi:hypothetical protein
MKRLILWCIVLCLLALPIAVVALAWLGLDDVATVAPAQRLTPEQVRRAESLVKKNDPRRSPDGAVRILTLSEEDLELAANHVLARYQGGTKLVLQPGVLTFWASAAVPPNPFGRYVNVEGALRQTGGLPELDALRIGRLPVPAVAADWLLARALRHFGARVGGSAPELVQSVHIGPGRMQLVYRWRQELMDRVRTVALPAADVERLQAFQQQLVRLAAGTGTQEASLQALLQPMFRLAAERSQQGDPVAENRAALIALAFHVNGRGLGAIVPQAAQWPQPQPRKVTVRGRRDLAQHFTVSAALAATAGSPVADAIGLYKEIEDARGGSGFSFPDLAADRAGTALGARAIASEPAARAVQQHLAAGARESDFMPAVADLPERMNEQDFKRRFGAVGSPAYEGMLAEIERRLAGLALYR